MSDNKIQKPSALSAFSQTPMDRREFGQVIGTAAAIAAMKPQAITALAEEILPQITASPTPQLVKWLTGIYGDYGEGPNCDMIEGLTKDTGRILANLIIKSEKREKDPEKFAQLKESFLRDLTQLGKRMFVLRADALAQYDQMQRLAGILEKDPTGADDPDAQALAKILQMLNAQARFENEVAKRLIQEKFALGEIKEQAITDPLNADTDPLSQYSALITSYDRPSEWCEFAFADQSQGRRLSNEISEAFEKATEPAYDRLNGLLGQLLGRPLTPEYGEKAAEDNLDIKLQGMVENIAGHALKSPDGMPILQTAKDIIQVFYDPMEDARNIGYRLSSPACQMVSKKYKGYDDNRYAADMEKIFGQDWENTLQDVFEKGFCETLKRKPEREKSVKQPTSEKLYPNHLGGEKSTLAQQMEGVALRDWSSRTGPKNLLTRG